jgi:hypothetical protein
MYVRCQKLTREDERGDLLVLAKGPDEELGKITRVDELTKGTTGTGHDEGGSVLLGQVALVDQTGDDVRVDQVEVIVGSKDVGRDDRGEVASELLVVGTIVGSCACFVSLPCFFILLYRNVRKKEHRSGAGGAERRKKIVLTGS